MPQVIVEQPGVQPFTVPLSGKEISFGRADDSDVVLVADEVSRHHAKICMRSNKMVLLDLNSLNGTYVNRQRIVERVLSHLDEVWFGSKCRLIYRDDTHFGKGEESTSQSAADSQILQNVDRIRAEMDRVGNSMTLISRRDLGDAAGQKPSATLAEPVTVDVRQMSRAYRRLDALYKTSQVMTSRFDLNTRLAQVLDLVIDALGAERGFVMLRDGDSNNLVVKIAREMGKQLEVSSPSMGIAGRAAIDGEPVLMVDRATDQEFGMRDSIIMSQIVSAMCVPLRIEDRVLGSIYVDTRKQRAAFNEEDLELFCSLATQSAMAIDHVRLHEKVLEGEKKRLSFSRFLPSVIVEKIMNEDTVIELGGQKSHVTTLFCDIRGSSQLAESLAPQELVELLNQHFTAMTEVVFKWHGTLDKYIGDEIMAVFGAPISTGDDAYSAVSAALDIIRCNQDLNLIRRKENSPEIHVGIGIDTGDVIAGYIGSPMRMDYTVVGDRVNTAKRFCDMATAGKVVVGQETWEEIKDRVHGLPIGDVRLKGKAQPVLAYEILSIK